MRTPNFEIGSENFDAVKNLDSETKTRMILEIFDLGKDPEQNKKRRENFINLISRYHEQIIRSSASVDPNTNIASSELTGISSFDKSKKALHDEIMKILTTMSLSVGLSKNQRLLTEYLKRNRDEVGRLIEHYFTGQEPVKVGSKSEYLKTKEQLRFLEGKAGPEEE